MTGTVPRLGEQLAPSVAVIGGVGGAEAGRRQRADEGRGDAHVTHLAGGQFEGVDPAFTVGDGGGLGCAATTRSPDRLTRRLPFPPAAEQSASALVPSIIWMLAASNFTRAWNMPLPDVPARPPIEAIVDRPRRTIGPRAVLPTAPCLQLKQNPREHPPVVHPPGERLVLRKQRLRLKRLLSHRAQERRGVLAEPRASTSRLTGR